MEEKKEPPPAAPSPVEVTRTTKGKSKTPHTDPVTGKKQPFSSYAKYSARCSLCLEDRQRKAMAWIETCKKPRSIFRHLYGNIFIPEGAHSPREQEVNWMTKRDDITGPRIWYVRVRFLVRLSCKAVETARKIEDGKHWTVRKAIYTFFEAIPEMGFTLEREREEACLPGPSWVGDAPREIFKVAEETARAQVEDRMQFLLAGHIREMEDPEHSEELKIMRMRRPKLHYNGVFDDDDEREDERKEGWLYVFDSDKIGSRGRELAEEETDRCSPSEYVITKATCVLGVDIHINDASLHNPKFSDFEQ